MCVLVETNVADIGGVRTLVCTQFKKTIWKMHVGQEKQDYIYMYTHMHVYLHKYLCT
jgi:hypothetical protein